MESRSCILNNSFDNLIKDGIIEYIDVDESENCLIAMTYEDLQNISISLRQREREKFKRGWKKKLGKTSYSKYKTDNQIEATIKALKISHKDYCEVYRIEGLYYSQKGNLGKVKDERGYWVYCSIDCCGEGRGF